MIEENEDAIGIYTNEIRMNKFLNWIERNRIWLIVAGLIVMILILFFLIFLSVSRAGIVVTESKSLFETFIFLEIASAIAMVFFVFILFLNRLIRSRAEQQEEQLRKELRKIDYDIQRIEGSFQFIDDEGELHGLSNELENLRLERAALIVKSPQGWKRDISTKWGITLIASHDRLLEEEYRLRRRNRFNLLFGIAVAFMGASFFIGAGIVSYYDKTLQNLSFSNFPFYYLLCIPITIITEVVAIFFLRLFALTEQTIERNKNEMTNIELRLTASQLLEDKDKFGSLADTLSKEERNFILRKNETSATPETLDTEKLLEIISKLALKAGGVS